MFSIKRKDGSMKKFCLLLALTLIMSVLFCGCGMNFTDAQPESGFYLAKERSALLSSPDQTIELQPYVSLDTEEKIFTYGQSLLMSYAEYGYYEIKDDKLIATTQNETTYKFEIKDKNTLVMIDDNGNAIDEFVYSE